MTIKAILESSEFESLSTELQELYQQRNGNYELKPIEGLKTVADVERVQASLVKEREAHKMTKDKYKPFDSFLDEYGDEAVSLLDKIPELQAMSSTNGDVEARIKQAVDARLETETRKNSRKLQESESRLQELQAQVQEYENRERSTTVANEIRKAATDMKLRPEAIEDVLLYGQLHFDVVDGQVVTKDSSSFGAGLTPNDWLIDIQPKRSHWWQESTSAGAQGSNKLPSGIANPFAADTRNVTEQMKLVRENPKLAQSMATAAKVDISSMLSAVQ